MSTKTDFHEMPISWDVDGIKVHATITFPAVNGLFPAVVFVAGSGPTDRDWNNPVIPGINGSGALLARELTRHGFVTLRYDKRASGPHVQENLQQMVGKISMHGHTAELAGGVNLVARQKNVDPARIFVLTNSEGCIHALNYQNQGENPPFAGMVLTSAFARAAGDLAHSQIAAQMAAIPGGDGLLSAFDDAMNEFMAGRPVTVDETLPLGLRQVILAITQPVNMPFSRELWLFNPAAYLAEATVPVLIVIGKKDIQVDWETDGSIFQSIAEEHNNIQVVFSENSNHVLKYEPKPRSQITPAEAMATYSAEEGMLDPDTVTTIVSWLKARIQEGA